MKMVDTDYGIPDSYNAKFNDCEEMICLVKINKSEENE